MANSSSTAKRPAKQDATSSAQPVARFGTETVSAAVFKDQRTSRSGETFEVFNVSLRRSYRTTEGSQRWTNTLPAGDLDAAISALQQCVAYIKTAAAEDKAES